MHLRILIAVTVALTSLAGCGAADTTGEPVDDSAGPDQPAPAPDAGSGESLSGTLQGSAELEGGCAWLVADGGEQYEVIYPDGYEIRFDPVELLGPDGEVVASEGDEVTVTGRVATDRMSICQVGTIFEADSVG